MLTPDGRVVRMIACGIYKMHSAGAKNNNGRMEIKSACVKMQSACMKIDHGHEIMQNGRMITPDGCKTKEIPLQLAIGALGKTCPPSMRTRKLFAH